MMETDRYEAEARAAYNDFLEDHGGAQRQQAAQKLAAVRTEHAHTAEQMEQILRQIQALQQQYEQLRAIYLQQQGAIGVLMEFAES